MTNQNPAIPSKEATPGNGAAVVPPNQSAAAPAPAQGGQGNPSDGKVTIDLKEYRDLQRAKARTLSFDKRVAFRQGAGQGANPSGDGSGVDPAVSEATQRAEDAERRALQAEVRAEVRDLLEKDEFKALPKSTKEIILKNPAMLSDASTKEEALIDIEEFVRDQVIAMGTPSGGGSGQQQQTQNQPAGHETPPAVGAGGPAPVKGDELEDLSKLKGPARSRAAIRNAMKAKKAAGK